MQLGTLRFFVPVDNFISDKVIEPMSAEMNARIVARLISQLNAKTGLCFHVTRVITITPDYIDMFVFETKYIYSQALRLYKDRTTHNLQKASCINFAPEDRFQQPSLARTVEQLAEAAITPELFRPDVIPTGDRYTAALAEHDFGYGYAGTRLMSSYVPLKSLIRENADEFKALFDQTEQLSKF